MTRIYIASVEKAAAGMFNRYRDVLTVKELCEALSIGRNTAYALLHSGEIKSIRIGQSIKIPKKYLIEYISRN